ncbi:MAG: DNA methyltransferase [Planctomycetota bacterium]|jgi:adenine-specific DNA-methyltransferase
MTSPLRDILKEALEGDPRFVDGQGELIGRAVIRAARDMDRDLLKRLLSDPELLARFFLEIDGHSVFDLGAFAEVLSDGPDVALDWPGKTVEPSLEPKVLTRWRRHTPQGEGDVGDLRRDEHGAILENLVLRGDNLAALHTLKTAFAGTVRLIYIDPPYNTGKETQQYADRFDHAAWLTFMKNRLEAARELLAPAGLLFAQCDDREAAYLKVLLDELLGRENFLSRISWQRAPEGRTVLGQGVSFIARTTETLLCYARDVRFAPRTSGVTKRFDATEKALQQYSHFFQGEGERLPFKVIEDGGGRNIEIFKHDGHEIVRVPKETGLEERLASFDRLVRVAAQQAESSLQQKILSAIEPDGLFSVEYVPTRGKRKGVPKKAYYTGKGIVLFLRDYAETDGERVFRRAVMNDFWSHDEIPVTGIADEGGVRLRRGKKPEKLLQRIIEMATEPGDLVLDFFLGSGTTAAAAHKLGRRYVGMELLDYGENDAVVRLNNVIQGEASGISKAVGWNGGGEFITCELMARDDPPAEGVPEYVNFSELSDGGVSVSEEDRRLNAELQGTRTRML